MTLSEFHSHGRNPRVKPGVLAFFKNVRLEIKVLEPVMLVEIIMIHRERGHLLYCVHESIVKVDPRNTKTLDQIDQKTWAECAKTTDELQEISCHLVRQIDPFTEEPYVPEEWIDRQRVHKVPGNDDV